MGDKPMLRPGRAKAQIKFVTRSPAAADWVRNLANEMEVPLGAVFDTLVAMAENQKNFQKKVRRVWYDRYAEQL